MLNTRSFRLIVGICAGLASLSVLAAPPVLPTFPNVPVPMPSAASAKAMPLPIVGKPSLKDAPRATNTVHLSDGINEIIYVSSSLPNRIATPFASPQVVGTEEDIAYQTIGQDIYFVPGKTTPVGIFIVDSSRTNGPVASITLLPKDIPGQNIVLIMDQGAVRANAAEKEKSNEAPSDFVDMLSTLVRQVAQGGSPVGFSEARLDAGVIKMGALTVIPERQYAGQSMNIYSYRIENSGHEPIELSEPAFFEKGVRAVAFWPNVLLEPRMETNVIIVADQQAEERSEGGRR